MSKGLSRRQFLYITAMMSAGLEFANRISAQEDHNIPQDPYEAAHLDLTGSIRSIHDPAIIKNGDYYYVFASHMGIYMRKSANLIEWERPFPTSVFPPSNVPDWTQDMIPESRNDIWAPDIAYFNNKFHLYYSVSSFGSNHSLIGLATNVTLDSESDDYEWIDEGLVIRSTPADNYNCIDSNIIIDEDGVPWMSFGSHWSGIKMRRIDYNTGKLSQEDDTLYSLASRVDAPRAVEAPFIIHRGDYYYMFVSFDQCCQGIQSSYNVRVGRSESVTGPYIDREGLDMMYGGGTQVTFPTERWRGPGHNAILQDNNTYYIVYHAYDAEAVGRETLRIAPLNWSEDGWPSILPLYENS